MTEIDKPKVVALLNKILETELAGVVRYTHYSFLVFGFGRIPITEWLRGQANESLLKADEIEVPIQVNGKVRAKLKVPADITATALEAAARADERIKGLIEGKTVRKVIIASGNKLVNLVVG